jgi:tRNA-specific 2-thiouridylase
LGATPKPKCESWLKKFGLITAQTPESQEVCFIENKTENFLEKYIGKKEGKIFDKNKNNLGSHSGVWFYTIGQRKGIKLSNGPYYVASKDKNKNQLIVSKNERDLLIKKFWAKEINLFISGARKKFSCKVKIRYKSKQVLAEVVVRGKRAEITLKNPQKAVTPGQSVVFYKGEKLLGGGIIE